MDLDIMNPFPVISSKDWFHRQMLLSMNQLLAIETSPF